MNTLRVGDAVEIGFDVLMSLAILAGLGAFGVWLWPDGFLDTPLAALTLGKLLYAAGSLAVCGVVLVGLYFVVVEPILLVFKKD